MRNRLFTIIFILTSFCSLAQVTDETVDYDTELDATYRKQRILLNKIKIQRLRTDLIDLMKLNETESARIIFDSLKLYDNSKLMSTHLDERLLLEVYFDDYKSFIENLNNIDTLAKKQFNKYTKIAPPEDDLYETLIAQLAPKIDSKFENISEAKLNDENMFFADLGLKYLIYQIDNKSYGGDTNKFIRENLNKFSEIFIKTYPTSRFNTFIKEKIYYKMVPVPFGWGMDLSTGYGNFTGDVAHKLGGFGILGLGLEMTIYRFYFTARYGVGFGIPVKQSFYYNNRTWDKKVTSIYPEFGIGYKVINKKRFDLTPYASYTIIDISQNVTNNTNSSSSQGYSFDIAPCISAGMIIDIKFKAKMLQYNYYTGKPIKPAESYSILRIRPMYTFIKDNDFKGGMFAIHVGWAWSYRRLKRVHLD